MSDAEDAKESAEEKAQGRSKLMRGCGCLTGLCILGLGILVIGNFDKTAWASALSAVVIGFLVFSLSGVNGMWENK